MLYEWMGVRFALPPFILRIDMKVYICNKGKLNFSFNYDVPEDKEFIMKYKPDNFHYWSEGTISGHITYMFKPEEYVNFLYKLGQY